VASLIYHMTKDELTVPWYLPLQLLNRVESFLVKLETNPGYARQLQTPDGTRKILNESKKEVDLGVLRAELTALIEAVGTDYISYLPFYQNKTLDLDAARGAFNEASRRRLHLMRIPTKSGHSSRTISSYRRRNQVTPRARYRYGAGHAVHVHGTTQGLMSSRPEPYTIELPESYNR
jgi:hypothetical protein